MADENVRLPGSQVGPPASFGKDGIQQRGSAAAEDARSPARVERSEIESMLRWLGGLVFILICGWGLIGLVYIWSRSWKIGVSWQVATIATAAVSFILFFVLQKRVWLSRFIGLRLGPRSTQLGEALILWVFGPLALLRPTESAQAASARTKVSTEAGGGGREVVETVVFVVILVLLLKSFVAEAFVIPTGSQAETQYGYHKEVTCPQCDYVFPVNCSNEVDPPAGEPKVRVSRCTCPNCRLDIHLIDPRPEDQGGDGREPRHSNEVLDPGPSTGDRVLVAKYIYDALDRLPDRLDVVVFKYPGDSSPGAQDPFPRSGPQKNHVPMNYIKRLVGLPGETIGIYYGKLYVLSAADLPAELKQKYEEMAKDVKPTDLWRSENMHKDDLKDWLIQPNKDFHIVRKPPARILSMKRIVYDNDHPARDVKAPRWAGMDDNGAWSAIDPHGFEAAAPASGPFAWLRYKHILRQTARAELITDFMGYNSYEPHRGGQPPSPNWVGDLLLECEVIVDKPDGELALELSKGIDRFRARWDLASGQCTLLRLKDPHDEEKPPQDKQFVELDSKPTSLKGKGTFRVRFANIDNRLLVWVDNELPFGVSPEYGVSYQPFSARGPYANDLQPASIGARGGAVKVQKLKLWRDTYYTQDPRGTDATLGAEDWADKDRWELLRGLPATTMYVQPGHYLCLGDNSPESFDSRVWGLVPNRLLLGRALLVYWPFGRAGRIR
jgi:signal peptidase I